MKTGFSRHIIAFTVLALLPLAGGCYSNYKARTNQDLWEREMRLEEDCIYRLRWQLEDKQRELDEANARANSLNKQTDIFRSGGGGGGGASSGPDLGPPPAFNPNSGGSKPNNEAPRLPPAPSGLPEVQPGKPFIPGASNSRPSNDILRPEPEMAGPSLKQASYNAPAAADSPVKQAGYTTPADSAARPLERLNPDTEIEAIELNEGLTGEVNSTGEAGAGYLNVVIQQRDSHGKRVLGPGDVSIVVIDPALQGSAGRLARWDFDADEVPQHVRRNHDGGSLQFQLPWPSPPQHSDLRVFVRFSTFDGRRLEANLPIDVQINPADSRPRGWKKLSASSQSESIADQFADAQPAAHRAQQNSVYEAEDSDSGPALTGTPNVAQQSTGAPLAAQSTNTAQPMNTAPPANPSSAASSADKPLLDASRRPAWSPYR